MYQFPTSQLWLRGTSSCPILKREIERYLPWFDVMFFFLQRLHGSSLSTAFRKDFARAEAKMALKLFIRSLHHAAEMALDLGSPWVPWVSNVVQLSGSLGSGWSCFFHTCPCLILIPMFYYEFKSTSWMKSIEKPLLFAAYIPILHA